MYKSDEKKEETELERKMREYYIKCFVSEFSKICIFFIIFSFWGLMKEYLFALTYMMLLRGNGGGLHYKHYISCLLVSFTFLSGSILLAIYFVPARAFIYISLLLCVISAYVMVPVTSCNRPSATQKQIKKSKRNTVIILSFLFILICICPNNRYIHIGYWTIILHILQLFIAHITKEVKTDVTLGRTL